MSDVLPDDDVLELTPVEDTPAACCASPGCPWLLSLFALGGAPLAASLYLGLVMGTSLLWVPAFAILLGFVVLGAMAYVTRATGEPPFRAINRHINPVLGWAWALAALAAALAWCLPQYSIAAGVVRQNFGSGGPGDAGSVGARIGIAAVILLLTMAAAWFYDSPGRIVKLCMLVLKLVVAALAVCFLAAVCVQLFRGKLDFGQAFWGLIPDLAWVWNSPGGPIGGIITFWRPADLSLGWLLDEVPVNYRGFWTERVLQWQGDDAGDAVIAAAGTAVAVNVAFLVPHRMLRRGAASRAARGPLAKASLPVVCVLFVAVVSCVVMAATSQWQPSESDFRQKYDALYAEVKVPKLPGGATSGTVVNVATLPKTSIVAGATLITIETDQGVKEISHPVAGWTHAVLVDEDETVKVGQVLVTLHEDRYPLELPEDVEEEVKQARVMESMYVKISDVSAKERKKHARPLEPAECVLADLLQPRDAGDFDVGDFAAVLEPAVGGAAGPLLAVGVLAIVLLGVTLLTITAGWVICEMLGIASQGWPYRAGCLIAAVGVAGPFLCTEGPVFQIVVPASIFSLILLPLASATAMMMINCESLLGDRMPRGVRRVAWNVGLGMAVAASTVFSLLLIWLKTGDASLKHVGNEFGG
ncbi:MAG: divalent metal cation transporter, partial [Candidatus Nealsonbacteria bacterium]|nr:divalent metal cation transporter [Candidatus Nealsonbacteria bacterium]